MEEKLGDLLSELINTGQIVPDSLFELAVELSHELKDDWGLAILYSNISVYNLNTGEVQKGLANIEKAIKYARASNKPDWLSESYSTKIQLLMYAGKTKEAAVLASSLVKQYHDTNNLYYGAETYELLSSLSSSLGDYELTMKYDSIAIALARQSDYVEVITSALYTASENHSAFGSPEKGLILAEEAFQIAEDYELDFAMGNVLNARAIANTALGNYTEALSDYELLQVKEGDQGFTLWMISRGLLLQRIGRHNEARTLLLKAASIVKKTSNSPLELKKCYQALQTVGLNQAQYDSVTWYGERMKAEQDSLQTAENIKNLLELEKKYKTEEKEAKILLQQEQLVQQKIKLYATIFGLLLALVVGMVLFFLSRRLKKTSVRNEELLADKEVLIGEIHHRVKNNLQVVSSLLQIQRRGLESDDEKGREALLESQSRVSAMGLIHNKLYQGTKAISVHMPEYLEDLGDTLLDAYRLEEQVEIFYDVADLKLDVDKAIPLGLIINELVTNSFKYAFPDNREGSIEVALHREHGKLRLIIADNGVGLAGAKKRTDSTSYGTNLIELLTKKLKGSLRILEGNGYGIEIVFSE